LPIGTTPKPKSSDTSGFSRSSPSNSRETIPPWVTATGLTETSVAPEEHGDRPHAAGAAVLCAGREIPGFSDGRDEEGRSRRIVARRKKYRAGLAWCRCPASFTAVSSL